MAETILKSVGQGGVNRFADVETVQSMLNQVPFSAAGPVPQLDVDGLVGPKTIAAIRKFQQHHLKFQDGRVDPNQKTLAKLNEFDKDPAKGNPVRFQRLPDATSPNDGFEDANPATGAAPWLMVPLGGSKLVQIFNGGAVRQITSNNEAVARGLHLGSAVQIFGVAHGTTIIKAKDASGRVLARLDVSVKRKKTVVTSFHFVEDKKQRTTRTSATVDAKIGNVDKLLEKVNLIYMPQANIEFTKGKVVDPLKFDKDFGSEVRFTAHLQGVPIKEHEWDIVVAKRDPAAGFNVFFVWEYEDNVAPGDAVAAGTLAHQKSCLFEDNLNGMDADEVLAHEAGHNLGLPDGANAAELMLGAGASLKKIPRAHVDRINP